MISSVLGQPVGVEGAREGIGEFNMAGHMVIIARRGVDNSPNWIENRGKRTVDIVRKPMEMG